MGVLVELDIRSREPAGSVTCAKMSELSSDRHRVPSRQQMILYKQDSCYAATGMSFSGDTRKNRAEDPKAYMRLLSEHEAGL